MPHKISADELGLPIGTVVKVSRKGRTYVAETPDGVDVADKIASYALKNAYRSNKALQLENTKTGGTRWSQVPAVEWDKIVRGMVISSDETVEQLTISDETTASEFDTHAELVDYIRNAIDLKPQKLKIEEMWWKFAVRSALRGKNLLVIGPSGCGKTLLANAVKVALGREDKFFYVNLGATQDPRSTLIGNTHYSPENGTFVSLSYFAQAIQVPNALILLDETSRAHPEAHNILMPVLDHTQRYLRVDEKADSETIRVASGVSFILTANVGSEYTATRTMDRALLDRCTMFEMKPLGRSDELENLRECYPNVEDRYLKAITEISVRSREEIISENPKIDTIISTRVSEEMASLINDGFSLEEAAETCIYPYFSDAGGAESARSFMKALVQQFLPTEFDENTSPHRGGETVKNKSTPWG
jgi:MoxR-like ATPase